MILNKRITEEEKKAKLETLTELLEKLVQKYYHIEELALDLYNRISFKKPTKKAIKDFEKKRDKLRFRMYETKESTQSFIRRSHQRNALIKKLFQEKTEKIQISMETLTPEMKIYVAKSKTRENNGFHSKTTIHTNVGRIKIKVRDKEIEKEKWTDYNLVQPYLFYEDPDKVEKLPFYPIYKVIEVKKAYVKIQDIHNKQEIRLIPDREHFIFRLIYRPKYKYTPKIKNTKQNSMESE